MLQCTPTGWMETSYQISEDGRPLALLKPSAWREAATLTLDGADYRLYRRGWRGPFVLEYNGATLAEAHKPSAWRDQFEISIAGERLNLRRESPWRYGWRLERDGQPIGVLRSTGFWKRTIEAELPEQLPLAVRLFMLWLTLLVKRRDETTVIAAS